MYRNKEIKIRLTEKELQRLDKHVAMTTFSREGYIRTLLSGYEPQTKPSPEFFAMTRELWDIAYSLRDLFYTAQLTAPAIARPLYDNTKRLSKIAGDLQFIHIPKKSETNGKVI